MVKKSFNKISEKEVLSVVFVGIILVGAIGFFLIYDPNSSSMSGDVTKINNINNNKKVDNIHVKVGYRSQLLYLPAYVAKKNGFFKKYGLDAELVKFDSTNELVNAVLNGDVDAGIGGVNALVPLKIESNIPGQLKIFGIGIMGDNFDFIVTRAGSNINNVHDLEGKVLASFPGSTAKVWMRTMFEKEGLKNMQLIQISPSQQLNALASGSVDAVFVLEPLASMAEAKGIGKKILKSPISKYYKSNMPFLTSVMSTKFYNKNRDIAEKIIEAVDDASNYIDRNKEVVKKYYLDFTPVDDNLESKLSVATYIPSAKINRDQFKDMVKYFAQTGVLKNYINTDHMFAKVEG